MNRKGFTLVELIATLVVLGIILTITVVGISGVFKSTKNKTEDVFVSTIKDALDVYLTSSNAKKLNFNTTCSNTLSKSYGTIKVYKATTTFSSVINSEYRPIATSDLVNPANEEVSCNNPANIIVSIYRDENFVYYYSVSKSAFNCLKNIGGVATVSTYSNGGHSSKIDNLPEGFVC